MELVSLPEGSGSADAFGVQPRLLLLMIYILHDLIIYVYMYTHMYMCICKYIWPCFLEFWYMLVYQVT